MELRQLRYFLALYEHRHYQRAAAGLTITPQALNASIATLERDLGVKLFEHANRQLVPTRFADALVKHASLVCSEVERARYSLEHMLKADEGHIVVGVGWFSSQVLAAAALEEFMFAYPSVDVTLIEGSSEDLYTQLLRGDIDIVLSTPSEHVEQPYEICVEELWRDTDSVHARAEHPLASRDKVAFAELVDYPWIVSAGAESRTPRLLQACDDFGIPRPARLLRTDSAYAVNQLMNRGDFLILGGALPKLFGLPFMQTGVKFDVPELRSEYTALLAWRRSPSLSMAAQRFVAAVHRAFARVDDSQS